MDYQDTLHFLYNQLPMFQRVGGAAYKEGLDTSLELDTIFNHPHQAYKTIHVAGTNGKGSVSHTLASILQQCGYKVGLYTSPHLVDFRERIRVNGKMIPKRYVTDFIDNFLHTAHSCSPSFFELTMMMAFDYFRAERVDFAVIEVGLGGRLDSTNIISPILSVITNISFDHMQFLGNTLPAIAREKAGIIKSGVPVVIGEAKGEVKKVFSQRATQVGAPIFFAEESPEISGDKRVNDTFLLTTEHFGSITDELSGDCQLKNANTILHAVMQLKAQGISIPDTAVAEGFQGVCQISGLMGRWMVIDHSPRTVCDTAHNVGGMKYIVRQLASEHYAHLHIVLGFVKDKDISGILSMMPTGATYYFTNADIPRALPCNQLMQMAHDNGLKGESFLSVASAYETARLAADTQDMIYIGGSTYTVADLLTYLKISR